MSIERTFNQKDILYITDFPLTEEAKSEQPYSSFSSKQLQRHLEEAGVRENMYQGLLFAKEKGHPALASYADAKILKYIPDRKFNELYTKIFQSKGIPNTAKLGVDHVCYTYLSMKRPEEGDSDWTNSVLTKGQLKEDQKPQYAEDFTTKEQVQVGGFIQCTWLKDAWVSPSVWQELQDCLEQIRQVKPKLIVIGGKWSLLFLATLLDGSETQLTTIARTKTTFKRKIFFGELNKYRASLLKPFDCLELPECVVVPILNPAFHWVVPDKERVIKKDYERVAGVYRRLRNGESVSSLLEQKQELYILETPNLVEFRLRALLHLLDKEPTKICFDVETRNGTIDCIGFAYQDNIGYTIPFTYLETRTNEVEEQAWIEKTVDGKKQWVLETIPAGNEITIDKNYWSLEEEAEILQLLYEVMLHPNCLHVGQNLAYDCQWFYREWGLSINAASDTMILHHCLYNYMQKDLGLLASLYCEDFTHWKDELK